MTTPGQLTTSERILRYVQSLKPGAEVTVSMVCKQIGTRDMTTRKVSMQFRTMDGMEYVPNGGGHGGKWRRV